MKLSLIIPCYNEALNLPHLIARCKKVIESTSNEMEVIFVNNGSTDNSEQVLIDLVQNHPMLRVVHVPKNKGYGFGILSGLKAATGDLLAWTHADMQTDPKDVLKGLELFKKHPQPTRLFIKGKRFGRRFGDKFFTAGMSVFETLLMGYILSDINAQPTIFHKDFFATWYNAPNDFALDLYAYYSARKNGLEVLRIPVYFGKRLHGHSHWNIDWKSKIKFIKRTIHYSFKLKWHIDKN